MTLSLNESCDDVADLQRQDQLLDTEVLALAPPGRGLLTFGDFLTSCGVLRTSSAQREVLFRGLPSWQNPNEVILYYQYHILQT